MRQCKKCNEWKDEINEMYSGLDVCKKCDSIFAWHNVWPILFAIFFGIPVALFLIFPWAIGPILNLIGVE